MLLENILPIGASTPWGTPMPLPADVGLTMAAYSAEAGSTSQDALRLLASWAATLDQAETPRATDRA
jgi:hypothetical protein